LNQTLTLRIHPLLLKKLDTYLTYKKALYPTRSAFITMAIEEQVKQLESHLMANLKGAERDNFRQAQLHCRKFSNQIRVQKRKAELKRSLNGYFSRDKVQKLIDHESYEVAKWLYDTYAIVCEDKAPLIEPYDPKFDI